MKKVPLTRDVETKMVAGVMAGLARHFDQDPVLFRVAGIGALILSGVFPVLFVYLVAWLMIPPAVPSHADYTIDNS